MHVNLLFKKIAALIPCLLLTVALNAQTVTKAFRSVPLKTVLEEVERQAILAAITQNEGNLTAAAEQLGVSRQTLYNKMKRFNL
jgi:transcriptional regulator of acetoin/glycerol metabolism